MELKRGNSTSGISSWNAFHEDQTITTVKQRREGLLCSRGVAD